MPKRAKISATIVARNEEQKIGKCLSSIKPVVDEIIFIHDGKCEDSTLQIARRFTKEVFVREYVGEAEPHRRFAIEQASHDWILQIDADEYLTPELAENIPSLIKDDSVSGYKFKWNVSYAGDKPHFNPKLILYRKSKIGQFHGIPHEVVGVSGKIVTLSGLELGHNRTRSRQKVEHNTKEWPKIHGRYLEEHKYRAYPTFLLPLGYLFYPLLGTSISLLRGTLSLRDVLGNLDYHCRVWRSFSEHRLEREKKRGKR